jgi:hypothetical protein
MIKHTLTLVLFAAVQAAPAIVRAQNTTTPPAQAAPGTCDCPEGDTRRDLRNLAAFAPLGLLGALAAAGGAPALFASTPPAVVPPNVAVSDNPPAPPREREATGDDAAKTRPETPAPAVRSIPEPVSVDSMRAGLRAPNTGTPLPSVFLLGSGLLAVGCVTVFRTRS